MGNIQDINLLNKDMSEAQQDIQDLKEKITALGSIGNKNDENPIDLTELTVSIKKELHNHNERIKDLEVKLMKMQEDHADKDKAYSEPKEQNEKPEKSDDSSSHKDLEKALNELRK